ncbi:MAG TPA: LLM class flavin-dependent oxidoreductase [Candidatus Tectomicrobia bacterium]|jgi:alkanesulfonate monooxygenase SsuD/methylene tetrahydromethanopterin reductase-like flavin-dependent oxidoreductase (luciferase family)|nr:LLM class flavin-dependent oxidoreductase [Candidatus Tectomicrobia bacterium]
MRCGLNFFPSCRPERKSAEVYFREALDLCELADGLGYATVKIVEHYFRAYGGYSPSPLIFLAAAAQRTRHTRLVTGAVLPAFNHPLKLAAELAMVDCISGGRLDVGFARAFLPHEFEAFEVNMEESRARFEEGIAAVKRLWTEAKVTFEGRFHRFKDVTLLPRPVQQPHPPVLVAAISTPESFVWAGEQGYGLMFVPYLSDFEDLARKIDLYRHSYRTAMHGQEPPPPSMALHLYLAESTAVARHEAKPYVEQYMAVFQECALAWTGRHSSQYRGYEQMQERLQSLTYERVLAEGRALVGDPPAVCEQIRQLRQMFGPVQPEMQVMFGDMEFARARRSVELFGREVLRSLHDL